MLGIRDAGVLDLLCDPDAMAVWEALRAAQAVRSLGELSAASRRTLAESQRAIDRLEAAGLVSLRRARGRRTTLGYVACCRSLVVAYEQGQDGDLVERALQAMSRAVPACSDGPTAQTPPHAVGRFVVAASLDRAAQAELHWRVMHLIDYMRSLGMMSSSAAADGRAEDTTAAIRAVIDLEPLACGPNLHASIAVLPRSALHGASGAARSSMRARDALTRREWDVAPALASGSTRREIAARLGISANTVASIAKSIYRKLGVRSRLQLAARLRGIDGEPARVG